MLPRETPAKIKCSTVAFALPVCLSDLLVICFFSKRFLILSAHGQAIQKGIEQMRVQIQHISLHPVLLAMVLCRLHVFELFALI